MVDFDDYFKKNHIIYKVIIFYLPEQNGKAERIKHTINNFVLTILTQQKLLKLLWAEIAKIVVYLQNKSLISQSTTIMYKNLNGEKPYLGHLHILRY